MVWAAVASEGTNSRVMFFDEGQKVNSQVYLNMLRKKVLPQLTETFDKKLIFTQDGPSAHTAVVEALTYVSEAEVDRIKRVSGHTNVATVKF